MLKRMLFLLLVPGTMLGCTIHRDRPAVVGAHYVARCPVGYHFEGRYCHENRREPGVVVEISPR
jgi:hypothetical protein